MKLLGNDLAHAMQLLDKAVFLDFVIEVVRRIDTEAGFKVLLRYWMVERTLGWLVAWRRLVRHYNDAPTSRKLGLEAH